MMLPILRLALQYEHDVVLARQRARRIAELVGFDAQDQTRVATAVSEIARNAFRYARAGRVAFQIAGDTVPQVLTILVTDEGPGISDLPSVLAGAYRSETGMGLGIVGTRRLMDRFQMESNARGTRVVIGKLLPRHAPRIDGPAAARIGDLLAHQAPGDPFEEIQRQNQELIRTLDQLEKRRVELAELNRELEDTNRGVVALYAELDEKADHLRRADELKSRFLSNMSHEFRTPVNSIQALARMLLEGADGALDGEQERQVRFIQRAAESLSELVNDLLDLAKVEAGKIDVRPIEFDVAHLFGALRGMLRPLLVNDSVTLVFEEVENAVVLRTDEAKVSQILRNFISNALKFTERGEVRVAAHPLPDGRVAFSVSDTGIGIAREDYERIFHEFGQVDSPVQRRVKGTGLGLPLCRKLAELLGGTVSVDSTPGLGSTFTATIPRVLDDAAMTPVYEDDPERIPILLVEDHPETAFLYDKALRAAGYHVLAARSAREARDALAAVRPRAIVLDVVLRGEDSWALLTELKRRPDTSDIPVAMVSTIDDRGKANALGADGYLLKPVGADQLTAAVAALIDPGSRRRVLVVDDEEVFRYVLRQHLSGATNVVYEASSGPEGLELARSAHPDVICLDLGLPGLGGREVLRRLKDDPATRAIPVVVVTSSLLDEGERHDILRLASGLVPKETLSRDRALAAVAQALRAAEGASP
jgi:signal transduction histidine kinase/CheY-like chemotaxis protein